MLADKQREAQIEEKGQPKLVLEFDVFNDNSLSMWSHFDHDAGFDDVKKSLEMIKEHISDFLNNEKMCPFYMIKKE